MDFRLRRRRLGLTQKELAALCGVSHTTISNVELGIKSYIPTVRTIEAALSEFESRR
jgi:transcriptional regulator with XRE-family HTH domain